MAKKIKAKKKQKEENRLFMTIILIAVGFVIIGGAAALIFGSANTGTTAGSHDAAITASMNQLGSTWQSLGVASWLYRPGDVMIYVDMSKWQNMSLAQKQKLVNKVGKDMENLVSKHGQDPKQLYIMFHSAQNQEIMIATYSGASGGQIQQ